jgi:hypothetical protein
MSAEFQSLPPACNVGSKKNSKGNVKTWIGYKLHIDAAKLGVAHVFGISLKVICFDARLFDDFWIGRVNGAKREDQFFDFPLVQQALLMFLHPSFLLHCIIGMQLAC